MQYNKRWLVLVIVAFAALQLVGCTQPAVSAPLAEKPVTIEKLDGAEFNRVILTEKAAKRLDVQTTAVVEEQMNGQARLVVPYAALIYGLKGETWLYTNPEPLVYVREVIEVDFIEGGKVVLTKGPSAGTNVATVAVAELYGAETGIGK